MFAKLIKNAFEHTATKRERKARENRFETFYFHISARIKYSQPKTTIALLQRRARDYVMLVFFNIFEKQAKQLEALLTFRISTFRGPL